MPKRDGSGRKLHIDLVRYDWSNLREELQERIPADDPRAEHAGYDGDYARYSQPHTMKECPYA